MSEVENSTKLAADLEIALKLHDDIYEECREKKVDRFDKYKVKDSLSESAIKRVKSREGKRLSARFSTDYWAAWRDTLGVLEKKSEDRIQEEKALAYANRNKKKKPYRTPTLPKKKQNPRERLKGLAFGPPNAEMPALHGRSDPNFQLPVETLFCELSKSSPPKDPCAMPQPIVPITTKGGSIPCNVSLYNVLFLSKLIIQFVFSGNILFVGGPPRPGIVKPVTAACELKTTEELLGPIFKKPVSFTSANRFKADTAVSKTGCCLGLDELKSEDYQGKFGKSDRIQNTSLSDTLNATPAPNEYKLPGMFDKTLVVPSEEVKTRRLGNLLDQRSLRNSTSNELARVVTFGYGCSFEEHRKYGLCLDGMCGRRSRTEDVILLTNKDDLFKGELDRTRLRHTQDRGQRKFATPMQAAIITGDFERVSTLVNLGYNINEIDPISRRSAIHEAVVRGYMKLVASMCEAYAVRSVDHPVNSTPPPFANTAGEVVGPSPTTEQQAVDSIASDLVSNESSEDKIAKLLGTKKKDYMVMRLDLVDCNGESVFHYCAR